MPHQKHTAILIDDEPVAIEQLTNLLVAYPQIKIIDSFNSAAKALISIVKNQPDLLFLDVQMPHQDGIGFLKDLQQLDTPPTVIMVTAYENYILEAFRNNAFDYLLKPVERTELQKVIERYDNTHPKQNIKKLLSELDNKIRIPGVYETHFLNPEQIFYIKGDGKYSDIVLTDNSVIKTSMNLKVLDEMLPSKYFKRISKSHIINLTYLQKSKLREKVCCLKAGDNEVVLGYSRRYFAG